MKLRYLGWIAVVSWMLTGCALVNETGTKLFGSPLNALAIVNGQPMQGDVRLLPDRTGTVSVNASGGNAAVPISQCAGRLRFTGTSSGEIDLRCNEGSMVTLVFSMVSDATAYAYGRSATVPASLTFGMNANDARAYLQTPSSR
jgi:hypothetical protein